MLCEFAATFKAASDGGYIAVVDELAGANTEVETFTEARANLREVVGMVLEANRFLVEEELGGAKVFRERLGLTA